MQNITVKFGKHNGELKPLTMTDATLDNQSKNDLSAGNVNRLLFLI